MTTVVNVHYEDYDVMIDRSTEWGNPFRIGVDGGRNRVITRYREWLWERVQREDGLAERLLELEGKRLGCWCKPKACHGDVLVRAIEWAKAELSL